MAPNLLTPGRPFVSPDPSKIGQKKRSLESSNDDAHAYITLSVERKTDGTDCVMVLCKLCGLKKKWASWQRQAAHLTGNKSIATKEGISFCESVTGDIAARFLKRFQDRDVKKAKNKLF